MMPADRGRMALYRPGKAQQKGFFESFSGRHRDELSNETLFPTLSETREKIRAWQHDYNHHRPHSVLGNIPPAELITRKRLEFSAA
ncbi:integrase core domain-containing protein [Tropicimonas omnivorans]|uniref:integrase core domain-containing protein n=1 Tax=Tropicimonas omnivorans TaxID=3075590 RepID=UPI003D779ED6